VIITIPSYVMWLPERLLIVPQRTNWNLTYRSLNGAYWPGTSPPGTLVTSGAYTASREAMYSLGGKSKRIYKPCQHYRVDQTVLSDFLLGRNFWYTVGNPANGYWIAGNLPSSDIWAGLYGELIGTSPAATFGTLDNPVAGLPSLWSESLYSREIPDPTGLTSLIDRSLVGMLPGIRPRLSLPNTLYELKDFKSLPTTLMRIKNVLVSIIRAKASLRSLFRSSADGYLQAQFNLLPLLKDISGIRAALVNVSRELNYLRSNAGKRLTTHWSCDLSDSYPNVTTNKSNALSTAMVPTALVSRRHVQYSARKFCATLDYSFNVKNLSGLSDETAALLDAFGVFWSPAIIWNALPWSFVVDWVISVSKWLDRFKTRNLEPVTNIHQYCWSINVRREILCSVGYTTLLDVRRVTEHAYKRVVTIPDYGRAFQTSGINSREFILAAALGLSRV
jgi:hypothetical protein